MTDEYAAAAGFFAKAIDEFASTPRDAARVVDFGCGAGALVAALRSLGIDAVGCDVELEKESEHLQRIRIGAAYRLPYDDASVDVVLSTSVFEHVQNKAEAFREIRRILKPGGVSMHWLPAKWYLPREPHIHVPLANAMWPRVPGWWLALWARLGVRNEFQRGDDWRTVVAKNAEFCRHGLSYWSLARYRRESLAVFGNFRAPMQFYAAEAPGGLARTLRRLPAGAVLARLSAHVRMLFFVQRRDA